MQAVSDASIGVPPRYTVVIPVLNQLKYTKMCVESLLSSGTARDNILIIDNASVDETAAWLQAGAYRAVSNRVNLGCGGAWTQGALLAGDSEWVLLLNNDVVLCPDFCARLLTAAEQAGLDVVSPAMVENELDYDFAVYAERFVQDMATVVRHGRAHGVCFAVRTSVFHEVGFPDTDRSLGGHEDLEFFLRCIEHGKSIGTVGAAFLHHFGSITQKALKVETGVKSLGRRQVFYRKVGMGWLQRKYWKIKTRREQKRLQAAELAAYGKTLHAIRQDGAWVHL